MMVNLIFLSRRFPCNLDKTWGDPCRITWLVLNTDLFNSFLIVQKKKRSNNFLETGRYAESYLSFFALEKSDLNFILFMLVENSKVTLDTKENLQSVWSILIVSFTFGKITNGLDLKKFLKDACYLDYSNKGGGILCCITATNSRACWSGSAGPDLSGLIGPLQQNEPFYQQLWLVSLGILKFNIFSNYEILLSILLYWKWENICSQRTFSTS